MYSNLFFRFPSCVWCRISKTCFVTIVLHHDYVLCVVGVRDLCFERLWLKKWYSSLAVFRHDLVSNSLYLMAYRSDNIFLLAACASLSWYSSVVLVGNWTEIKKTPLRNLLPSQVRFFFHASLEEHVVTVLFVISQSVRIKCLPYPLKVRHCKVAGDKETAPRKII